MTNQSEKNNKTFSLPTSIKIVVSEGKLKDVDVPLSKSSNKDSRCLPDKDESNNLRKFPFITKGNEVDMN